MSTSQLVGVTEHRKLKRRNPTKFWLGFSGERWAMELPGLVVPIPDSDKHVIVMRTQDDGFKIFTADEDYYCENQLMAAAFVRNFMDNYHAR